VLFHQISNNKFVIPCNRTESNLPLIFISSYTLISAARIQHICFSGRRTGR